MRYTLEGWINWRRPSGVLCDRRVSCRMKGRLDNSDETGHHAWCGNMAHYESSENEPDSGDVYVDMDV